MKRLIFLFFLCIGASLYGQNKTVTGVVNDDSGYPMPGAFILQQGTSNGAMTDLDGVYEIKVPEGAVLVVSCMGFLEQQVTVGASNRYDFTLATDALMMEEAVVVGYGTQKAKDLTAPISNIKGDELSKQITSNPMSALQGKVAGVQVINTGVPGGSPTVKIRGMGSIGDFAKPLYIVDGVFVDDLGFISNGDIQEMTILKDASAAAIYGVRAANGVVIVTTRKGVTDHTDISYDGYVGVQVPVNVMKLANAAQYVELINEANQETTGYVPINLSDYPADTDWYSELLRPAFTHSHTLDVSGATEKTNYSLGVSYLNQDGIMNAENDYNRFNIRARLDQKVNDWLSLGVNTLVSQYGRRNPDSGAYFQAFVNPPVYPVYNDANTAAYPESFDSPQRYGYSPSYGNPFARAYYYDNSEKGINLVFSSYMEMKFLQNRLKLRSAYNMEFQGYESRNYTPEYFVGGSQGVTVSSLSKTFGLRSKHIIDNTITFSDNKGKHSYTAMAGQSTRVEKFSGMTGFGTDVPSLDEQAMYIGNGSQKNLSVTDLNPGPYRFNGLSFFTRGSYNYADTYLATVTMRADGSSKYNRKWGFFPSVGLGWVMTSEDFMKSQRIFEYLKLRASWGLLGNDSVPANSAVTLGASGYSSSGVFGDVLLDGVGAQTVLQNYLEWEVVNEFDVGTDFAFRDKRLTGELDYYNRTTNNVVFYVPVATGGGTAELLANNGVVRNSGFEFALHWTDSPSEDFHYNVNLNLTTLRNRVVSLEGRDYIPGGMVRNNYSTRTLEGYPIGSFWGYKIDYVYEKTGEAMLDKQKQSYKKSGYFRYTDIDHDGDIDDDDKTYLGSPMPWLIGGLDFNFGWKNIDFTLSLQGQAGNKILNAKRMNRDNFATGNYDLDFYKNRWTESNKKTSYPSAEAMQRGYTQQCNEFFVEDGSYIRIQNIQLGYTFSNLPDKYLVRNVRCYLSAQRPFTYFRYNGFTTEIGGSPIASGIDTSTYPMQAIYTLGIKANF